MHQVITVHADAEIVLGSDFAGALADLGDATLQGTPEVRVSRGATRTYDWERRRFVPGGPWSDVTKQFLAGNPEVNGTRVLWTKKRRGAGEQTAGVYVVWCRVRTDTGAYLVDTFELEVLDTGSVQ
jgi:hypothetical protein